MNGYCIYLKFYVLFAHVDIVILIENTEQLPDDLSPFKCHSHANEFKPCPILLKMTYPPGNEQLAHHRMKFSLPTLHFQGGNC